MKNFNQFGGYAFAREILWLVSFNVFSYFTL
jgi:hypothetical protein